MFDGEVGKDKKMALMHVLDHPNYEFWEREWMLGHVSGISTLVIAKCPGGA